MDKRERRRRALIEQGILDSDGELTARGEAIAEERHFGRWDEDRDDVDDELLDRARNT